MYKEFYSGHELLGFPLFALFFFLAVFTFVVVRVMRKRHAPHYDAIAHLPLADDLEVSARGHGHV
jgi:cbb3-type cytochrome oxidase subunit 3